MSSLVVARVEAGDMQIYGVHRQEECEGRDLVILGEVLVAA
jgi:precorrin-4 methylase